VANLLSGMLILLLSIILLIPLPLQAETFLGTVTRIIDGDTLVVKTKGRSVRVRLYGVDSPENGQPYGEEATKCLSDIVSAGRVWVESEKVDRYKRQIGNLSTDDGTLVNQELVKRGCAWWYRRYATEDRILELAEKDARQARRGLWTKKKPVPPWEWRKGAR